MFVVREGKLLLGRRNSGYIAGTWGIPGGHLETGELMIETAKRELSEETGIKATHFKFSNIVNDPRSNGHYIHIGFIAENPIGEPRVTEPDRFDEWRWFPLDNLPKDIFPGHTKQIELFISGTGNFADN